ncbi:MAG: type II secretion system major pseudopilin GspG [Candidatus Binatia bacterium]
MIYHPNKDRDRDRDRGWRQGQGFFSLSLSRISVSFGFSLIEVMVVMVIIGLILALVGPTVFRQEEKAKSKAARAQIELIGTALDTFRLDVGRYPTSQEGLDALRRQPGGVERWDGPYLKKEVPKDPWGNAYVYKSPGEHGPYDVLSYGADGVPGGDGDKSDVASWEG